MQPARLGALIDAYDVLVVDQWGCLHDGHRPLPGAREALVRARARACRVVLVSNSSRPAAPSVALLRGLGFEDDLYDAMITAGELGRRWLRAARAAGRVRRGHSVVEPYDPACSLAAAGVEHTEDPDQADVLVVSGITLREPAAYDPVLRAGVARGVELLCLNPDRVSVQPDGRLAWCPGVFAERYRALGGRVRTWGKPGPEIYAAALAAAPGWTRGLAIGDSLEHDVRGGRDAGLDTLFLTQGVHWAELAPSPRAPADPERLAALFAAHGVVPTHVATGLAW